ncbi:hypothetical protein E0Z10_g1596 [Xylaria hypoxylon]|uniref:Heterokaryon incompatibility domain-containing protein n=1 Tax=Xylaria hypoxylon TaxID=37992 RepID=A0A4Z0ZEA7_9PEZI|nr:hypothetical protein E0Z10_g1596 [Xylaria hypoxylon]
MAGPTGPLHLLLESETQLPTSPKDFFRQASPFLNDNKPEVPPTLVKSPDFNQQWEVVLDNTGSYVDDLGRRVAVKRRYDDGSLSGLNDVHCAAHNLACLTFGMIAEALELSWNSMPLSILRLVIVRSIRGSWREDVTVLAIQEMTQMEAQADAKTNNIPAPNPYRYPVLLPDPSPIRLVVLLPSAERYGDIMCKLCNSTLGRSDTDRYEALSYVWGDPSKRKSISVDGKPFQVTENLESALRNLRYRDRYRVLWINSICINQSNVAERNAQVQQMGGVYRSAKRVVVWLGPESEDSSDALDLLVYLSGFGYKESEPYPVPLLPTVKAFYSLLQRPWFKRVWCVRELILAKDVIVQCGHKIALWEQFMGFMLSLQQSSFIFGKEWARRDADGMSTLTILAGCYELKSSDPRDKIFALYGLIPDEDLDRDALKPDYALNTSEVYIRFALRILQNHRNLDILSTVTCPGRSFVDTSQTQSLPSWTPDWRDGQQSGVYPYCQFIAFQCVRSVRVSFDNSIYTASLNLKATPISLQDDSRILVLDGINLDIIDTIGDILQDIEDPVAVSQWKEIVGLPWEHCYQYTGQPVHEAFFRTVAMDLQLETREENIDWLSSCIDQEAMTAFMSKTLASAQKGDCVVVLFGGKAPFIMRSFPEIELYYLLGESYVHGIMDGEAIHQPRIKQFKDLKVETFHIG